MLFLAILYIFTLRLTSEHSRIFKTMLHLSVIDERIFVMEFSKQKNIASRKVRQSNIELLRIVAMIIIIAHHFAVHGDFEFSNNAITINRLWIQFIEMGGKIGVNIFVLISGYFLISSKSIKLSKIVKLWLQIFTYSIGIFLIFVLAGIAPFQIKMLIKSFFPITFSLWWFASTYFVLYLLSPYLNKLLLSLDKIQYQKMLLLIFIIWCLIPTFTGQPFQSNNLLWFMFLYAIAGYIKIYSININSNIYIYIFGLVIIAFLSVIVFDYLGMIYPIFAKHATFFYGMQRLPILLIPIMMFIGFSKINLGYKPIINIISSATFGVYLIHDNPLVRPFLWETVFRNATFSESPFLIPYSLLVIFIVFICCTAIELLRIYLLEKYYMNRVKNFSIKVRELQNKMGKAFNKILSNL